MKSRITYKSNGDRVFEIEGKEVTEREFRQRTTIHGLTPGRPPRGHTASCWPARSQAMAVHPSQISEALERNKKYGVTGVSYDPISGDAILADRGARRDLMRLEGCHDRDGGYGDDHATASPMPPLADDATGGESAGQDLLDESFGHRNPHNDPTAE